MRRGARAMWKGHEKRCKGIRIFQNSNWGPCTKLYCLSFWYKDKRYGPCTHQRPLHISKKPLHPFLFSGCVALAHGPCTSSRGPCTGPCPRKMSLFGRLSGMSIIWYCPNVSTTPIKAMGCRQCLPLSVVQLKGKHCRKPHCRNGVVDTFGLSLLVSVVCVNAVGNPNLQCSM